jgi:Ser-tRNA(Ala) deacylase AlaX
MRLHLAAELVLELVYRALPGVEKTGAHIAADKARIDFAWPKPPSRVPCWLPMRSNSTTMHHAALR